MFDFFKSSRYHDEVLGPMMHRSELWVGKVAFSPYGEMELRIAGEAGTPDEQLLELAKKLPMQYSSVHGQIEAAFYQHFLPRMQAVAHKEAMSEQNDADPNAMMKAGQNEPLWSEVIAGTVSVGQQEKVAVLSDEEKKLFYSPNSQLMWSQMYPAYVLVHRPDAQPTIDMVFNLEWDANRTVTARIRHGKFVGMMDSHDMA